METIALSLVSHTNVGKTTLARTLLRRDVGAVFDQAHVTELAEAWPLLETSRARLLLWDTPGFGDSARLLKRLRLQGNPIGWFLHAVWDKATDRALWCSQEAVRHIRQDGDVVLYLVNAAEGPDSAAYVPLELELLGWLEKPVLLLLNQTGAVADAAALEALEAPWRALSARFPHVRGVLSLDAFTRSWVQEATLLECVAELLPEARRPLMAECVATWNARNRQVFERALDALAALLAETAADTEGLPSPLAGKSEKQRAMTALAARLEQRQRRAMDELLAAHGLDGEVASTLRERVEDFVLPAARALGTSRGALFGGLLGGAATGVGAELLAGGLGFGSGVIVGAALGALGGAGLAKGYALSLTLGKPPAVRWSHEALETLVKQAVLRYLAVAQFGRGRGAFHDDALLEGAGEAWTPLVERAFDARREALRGALKRASGTTAGAEPDQRAALRAGLGDVLRLVLLERFPSAAAVLDGPPGGARRPA